MSSGGIAITSILLPNQLSASLKKMNRTVKLGVISDLHQDVMHDASLRLDAFVGVMKKEKPQDGMRLLVGTSQGSKIYVTSLPF